MVTSCRKVLWPLQSLPLSAVEEVVTAGLSGPSRIDVLLDITVFEMLELKYDAF
jgi:hypothetical protein